VEYPLTLSLCHDGFPLLVLNVTHMDCTHILGSGFFVYFIHAAGVAPVFFPTTVCSVSLQTCYHWWSWWGTCVIPALRS
jgi:hypothetical protein